MYKLLPLEHMFGVSKSLASYATILSAAYHSISLQMNKPTEKPSATRPPESSHTPAKTSSEACSQAPKAKRDLEERMPPVRCRQRSKNVKTTTSIEDAPGKIVVRTADCGLYPQPCLHYNSIIKNRPDYRDNPCPYKKRDRDPELEAKKIYGRQHPKHPGQADWWSKIPSLGGDKGCEADEWPPARLYYVNDGYDFLQGHQARNINRPQFIRLMDGTQNGNAGQLWRRCSAIAERKDVDTAFWESVGSDRTTTKYTEVKAIYTRTTMRIQFSNFVDAADDGLQENACQPQQKDVDHRGFALLNDDPWFNGKPEARALTRSYLDNPNFKRDWIDPDQIAVMEANSSKRITDEELKKDFGVIRCASDGCEKELADLPPDAAEVYGPPPDLPVQASVTSSTLSVDPALANRKAQVTPQKKVTSADFPQKTH